MIIRPWPEAAVAHLRLQGIVFEPGLSDDEIARVERACRFRFLPDLRLFLQTALPVTGGFPNWRSESEDDLRNRYLDPPARGVLFDVEHNDFWPEEWGPRPANPADSGTEAKRRLTDAPRLIPVRSQHYLPAHPAVEGNPVISVRQTDIACMGRDLPSYLMALFTTDRGAGELPSERTIPFWTQAARTSRVRVPNLAGPFAGGAVPEYEHLCRVARRAGFWAEVVPLGDGGVAVTFDRREPPGDRKHGVFWVSRRDFGWLVCVRCPRFYFAPDADRIPELCLALLRDLPHEELTAGRLPFWNFRLSDPTRREFGLVAIQHFTQLDDDRERKLRAWERRGWRAMARGQEDAAWAGYAERFGYPAGGPFRTPTPSITWDIAHVYLRGGEHLERVEADLNRKALAALRGCTRPGEEVLALDWNHPCYFLDPHAATADERPESWPVPVLPNGDHYIFLAPDHRLGIVGNCVDMTVCVFGRELLTALDRSPPLAFVTPTWPSEERRANEARWADLGWRRLTVEEKDDIWERFDARFQFSSRTADPDGPAIAEPAPSLTWTVGPAASGGEVAANLTLAVLHGLQRATRPGELLYALGPPRWYEHYAFDPHRLGSPGRDSWAMPVYPADSFAVILAPDLRFGVVGNPVEKTLCVFGGELLGAMADDLPRVVGRAVRRDGAAVRG